MTISEAGKSLTQALTGLYSPREAANIAAMVMEKLTAFSRSERLVHKHLILDAGQQNQFENFKSQLLQHKPVQYVLNEAWFCGLPFYVDGAVLIPRPETEELVNWVVEDWQQKSQGPTLLDIGTGSGCVAVSLKKKLREASVFALDISEKALQIAKQNFLRHDAPVQFFQQDILNVELTAPMPACDVIVSNPPYIMQQEYAAMQGNVLEFEPHLALFVPDKDPLLFYKAIADFSLLNLKPAGKLYFEINELMGNAVAEMLQTKGFKNVQVRNDLQQKNRMVSASL